MKYGKYLCIVLISLPTISIGAIFPSAAKYSSALFLNLSRNSPQKLSKNLPQIRRSIKDRPNLINSQQKRIPFSLPPQSKLAPPSAPWWHGPAKAIAALTGGMGLMHLNVYLHRQRDLLMLETFINTTQTDLSSTSLDQITKNIKTLEYYAKIDDPNTSPKAKELLKELQNLYITKKYQETSLPDFEETIKKSPGNTLIDLKKDIISVNSNNDIVIPEAIVTKLTALQNTPTADALITLLKREIAIANYALSSTTSYDKFFTTQAKQNLAVYNAIKDILSPTAAPDQHEQYASGWDSLIPLWPF